MVSFSDYQNSIFIDRVPYKQKNWQLHGILIIPFQINLFSPHMQKVAFQLRNVKSKHSSTSNLLEYTKSCAKKKDMLRPFLKSAPAPAPYMRVELNRD